MENIELQLEALREIRGWGTWIVGIGGAILGFAAAGVEDVREKYRIELKTILILACAAFICAVMLITAVSSAIEILPIAIPDGTTILGFDLKGVYGYPVLGTLPLFWPYITLHLSVSLIAFVLLTILWRKLFWEEE